MWEGQQLKSLTLKNKNTPMDLTVRWPGYDMDFRVIAFWYKKKNVLATWSQISSEKQYLRQISSDSK
jgi:hypothetical protein